MRAAQLPPHPADSFASMICECGLTRREHMMGPHQVAITNDHVFEPRDYPQRPRAFVMVVAPVVTSEDDGG